MIPDDLADWRLYRVGIGDDSIVAAKRTTVTFAFRPMLKRDCWEVTKLHGGRVLAREEMRLSPRQNRLLRAVP